MAYLYRQTITLPNSGTTQTSLPEDVGNTIWWHNIADSVFDRTGHLIDGADRKTTRIKFFESLEDATSWMNANRLTDSAQLASLAAYKAEHNVTITESWHELPEVNTGITGLLG